MAPTDTTKEESRIYLDIKKQVYRMNWRIMIDKRTGPNVFQFLWNGSRNGTCAQPNQWKASGHGVKYICIDNAGESLTLQDWSDSSNFKLGINFKPTKPIIITGSTNSVYILCITNEEPSLLSSSWSIWLWSYIDSNHTLSLLRTNSSNSVISWSVWTHPEPVIRPEKLWCYITR